MIGCFCSVFLATFWIGLENNGNLIWFANGTLIAYLLLAPRWRWRAYLLTGFAAQFLGGTILHPAGWRIYFLLAAFNICESAIGPYLLRRRSAELPQFTSSFYLLRFFACAVIAGPVVAGILFAIADSLLQHAPSWNPLLRWITTDALGISIATPACVAIFRSRLRDALSGRHHWIYVAALVLTAIAAFSQTRIPVIFCIYPLMAVVLLRFGLGWGSLGTLFIAATGSWCTMRGLGPFAHAHWYLPSGPSILLQLFIACGVFMMYAASTVLDNLRSTQQKLQKIVAIHNLVTQYSRDIILLADENGIPRYISPAVYSISGWRPEETMARGFPELIHPDDLPKVLRLVESLRMGASEGTVEHRLLHRSGDWIWMEANMRVLNAASNSGILIVDREISRRKRIEQARDFHQSVLTAIHEVSLDGIIVADQVGRVISYNRRYSEVWKVDAPDIPASLLGSETPLSDNRILWRCLEKTVDPEGFVARVRELYAQPGSVDHCEIALRDGRTLERYSNCLHSASGQNLGRVWFFRDITARKAAQQELQEAYRAVEALAITDPLTRIANRRCFDQSLTNEWRRGMRDRLPMSLLLIDIDLFKSYNDTYGHLRGDSCLKQVAEAMQDVVSRPADVVARYGGEEFAIILPQCDANGASCVAEQVAQAVRGRRLDHEANPRGYLTISVGCATMVPSLGQHASILIQHADEALYAAKHNGRNQVCTYSDALITHIAAQAS